LRFIVDHADFRSNRTNTAGSKTWLCPSFDLIKDGSSMAQIEFLDETIRDGQQSLWGMRLQAGWHARGKLPRSHRLSCHRSDRLEPL